MGAGLSEVDVLLLEDLMQIFHGVKLNSQEADQFVWRRDKFGFLVKKCL